MTSFSTILIHKSGFNLNTKTNIHTNHILNIFFKFKSCKLVCDRNQVLVSGTETKVKFWYQCWFWSYTIVNTGGNFQIPFKDVE